MLSHRLYGGINKHSPSLTNNYTCRGRVFYAYYLGYEGINIKSITYLLTSLSSLDKIDLRFIYSLTSISPQHLFTHISLIKNFLNLSTS